MWVHYTIVVGAAMSYLFALGEALRPGPWPMRVFLCSQSFYNALLVTHIACVSLGLTLEPLALNHLWLLAVFSFGPSLYAGYRFAVDGPSGGPLRILLFGLPCFTLLPALLILAAVNPGLAPPPIAYFKGGHAAFGELLTVLGFAVNLVYYALVGWHGRRLFKPAVLKREPGARALVVLLAGSVVLTFYILVIYALRSVAMLSGMGIALTVFVAAGHLVQRRKPDFFHLITEVHTAYRNSRLSGVDLESLSSRLTRLMQVEKVYRQEDLTLAALAAELDISTYQLSEFLNRERKQNFSRFVNAHRVEEAAQTLLKEPDASVLSVAFRVGFNSKATFNLAFRQVLGHSPREFLRQRRPKV